MKCVCRFRLNTQHDLTVVKTDEGEIFRPSWQITLVEQVGNSIIQEGIALLLFTGLDQIVCPNAQMADSICPFRFIDEGYQLLC